MKKYWIKREDAAIGLLIGYIFVSGYNIGIFDYTRPSIKNKNE